MDEMDNARAQRDAQRKMKARPAGSPARAYESMLRYLGVGLYQERRRRTEPNPEHPDDTDDTDDQ